MTQEEIRRLTKEEIGRRIREGVKAIMEQVLEEEMTKHPKESTFGMGPGYIGVVPYPISLAGVSSSPLTLQSSILLNGSLRRSGGPLKAKGTLH